VTLFTAGTELADFDILLLASDYDLMVELTTDYGNDVGDEPHTFGLLGSGTTGTWGPPLILTRDDSYANYTVNFGGGTLDVIDRVRVRNLSASQAAQCLIMAAT
jgi:hypothetical protein